MVFENGEQRKGYESLNAKQKRRFGDVEEAYPNWSYGQIMAKLAIEAQADSQCLI